MNKCTILLLIVRDKSSGEDGCGIGSKLRFSLRSARTTALALLQLVSQGERPDVTKTSSFAFVP